MNTHKAMKLPFGFLAVALISMSRPRGFDCRSAAANHLGTNRPGGRHVLGRLFARSPKTGLWRGLHCAKRRPTLLCRKQGLDGARRDAPRRDTARPIARRDQRNHLLTHRPNCRDCERRSLLLSQRRLRRGRAWCGGLLDPAAKPFGYYRDIPD